jgi:cytochrome c oxidase assembly factor CtaG
VVHGREGRIGYGGAIFYLFATAMHSGGLGALLTVSPRPWYPAYEGMTAAWGLTPLEDQQLAGLIMWIPAGASYLVAGLALTAAWIRESGRRSERWEARALPRPT